MEPSGYLYCGDNFIQHHNSHLFFPFLAPFFPLPPPNFFLPARIAAFFLASRLDSGIWLLASLKIKVQIISLNCFHLGCIIIKHKPSTLQTINWMAAIVVFDYRAIPLLLSFWLNFNRWSILITWCRNRIKKLPANSHVFNN